jgi:uncharacterized membrane protein
MTVTKIEGMVNSGLVCILISLAIFALTFFMEKSPYSKFGIMAEWGVSNILFLIAIIFLIFGIYFWVKAFVVKDD